MKVLTNKFGEVSVRWQYVRPDTNPKLDKTIINKDNLTTAFLEQGVGKDKKIIKQATVKKSPKDLDNKESARKFALRRLVEETFSRKEDLSDRSKIWEAYNTRK